GRRYRCAGRWQPGGEPRAAAAAELLARLVRRATRGATRGERRTAFGTEPPIEAVGVPTGGAAPRGPGSPAVLLPPWRGGPACPPGGGGLSTPERPALPRAPSDRPTSVAAPNAVHTRAPWGQAASTIHRGVSARIPAPPAQLRRRRGATVAPGHRAALQQPAPARTERGMDLGRI